MEQKYVLMRYTESNWKYAIVKHVKTVFQKKGHRFRFVRLFVIGRASLAKRPTVSTAESYGCQGDNCK